MLQSLFFVEPFCKPFILALTFPEWVAVAVLVFRGTLLQEYPALCQRCADHQLQSLFFVEPFCKSQKFPRIRNRSMDTPIFPQCMRSGKQHRTQGVALWFW